VRVFDLTNAASGPVESMLIDVAPNEEGAFQKEITAIALNKDGSLVAAAAAPLEERNGRSQISIWKVVTPQNYSCDRSLECEEATPIKTIAFSPDGSRLAFGLGQSVTIFSLASKPLQSAVPCREEHTGSIRDVAFSPDGKILATASGDTTLILWNAVTREQIAPPLTGHQAPVVTVAFSPDGKWLASGSDDHSVILWNVGTRQRVARLAGHSDTVRALAFSPDVQHLYSGSFASTVNAGDGGLRKWELDPVGLDEICRQRTNRNLSRTEWNAYIRSRSYHKTWPDLAVPGEVLQPK
jgi:WD40 repeat protein